MGCIVPILNPFLWKDVKEQTSTYAMHCITYYHTSQLYMCCAVANAAATVVIPLRQSVHFTTNEFKTIGNNFDILISKI